ncbi:hypothetical protein [Rhodovulum euryhalinum]|uniref:Dolichyl-phosphate-mannose-protein mannosyltransferase n=1 Tax=Rhodovulum euryhalinum TaxID=35805 RepID=A0A4R2K927_9RHOB|nr:hypothetical protein [Rhodovulum euryhalinum]TCO69174.1 hypothetical protein EV655_1175 [Rhodovulum euryhalinum]
MKRSDPVTLAAAMAAVLGLATWAGLARGGLYPVMHEGDMLHMVQIVLREAAGEWPHLDFMTPLGVLAFAPVTLFVRLGWPLAEAFVLGQALVGVVILPAAWWAGLGRLPRGWAHLFGAGIMVLVVALVPATPDPDISLSMNYNRWAWALLFVVLVVAVLPARWAGPRARLGDGLVLGLGLAALALIKVTFFLAAAPVVVLALWLGRDRLGAIVALAAGLAVTLAVTMAAGPMIWPAYLGDLGAVASTEVRAYPSASLPDVVAGTAARVGSLLYLAAVILARRAGQARAGLLLLAAAPGLVYVTYQNFGNDPVWLFFLGLAALALRPVPGGRHAGPGQGLTVAGWGALLLVAPVFMAMAESPLRNLAAGEAGRVEILPGNQGIWMPDDRVAHVQTRVSRALFAGEPAAQAHTLPEPTLLLGQPLENCRLISGLVGWFRTVSDDIGASEFGGRPVLVADMLNAYWLYGGVAPLPGGAPWYYGGLPGVEVAELLLVPQCATRPDVRARVLRELADGGFGLTELRRTPDYVLLAIRPAAESAR